MATIILCAGPQFNVLSGGLVECLDEPWHVGVCAAGTFFTTTVLSIPQRIIREQSVMKIASLSTTRRLTVVVITNKGRG